jgi:hypothetical protein
VERLFIGICAGFLSHFIYSLVVSGYYRENYRKYVSENEIENEKVQNETITTKYTGPGEKRDPELLLE